MGRSVHARLAWSTRIDRPRTKPYRAWWRERPSLDCDGSAPAYWHDSRLTGVVSVQGFTRSGDLCGQGIEPSPAVVELLPGPAQHAPAHGPDGGNRGVRRVDRGPQRGRGVDARVDPDQTAPAAVQHPSARRQELPVPRCHARRAVPEGVGDARPQTQGDEVLRAVRARL